MDSPTEPGYAFDLEQIVERFRQQRTSMDWMECRGWIRAEFSRVPVHLRKGIADKLWEIEKSSDAGKRVEEKKIEFDSLVETVIPTLDKGTQIKNEQTRSETSPQLPGEWPHSTRIDPSRKNEWGPDETRDAQSGSGTQGSEIADPHQTQTRISSGNDASFWLAGQSQVSPHDDEETLADIGRRDRKREQGAGFAGYEIQSRLGAGGMGEVFMARQIALDRMVALKFMKPEFLSSENAWARFEAEAKAAGKLDHPGIVKVFDVGVEAGQPYFTMSLVEGESLSERLRESPLDSSTAANVVAKVADAIDTAHQIGLVHRDLKPSNILLSVDGEPRVTDFGLVKTLDSEHDLTQTGQMLGTPSYMPPEQARNAENITAKADIYSLGAVLYATLTGRPPFQAADGFDVLEQIVYNVPVPPRRLNPKVERDLETICLKCLEKDPQRRYNSAAEVANDLRRFSANEPIHAKPIRAWEVAWRWCQRNRAVAFLIAMVVCSLLAGTLVSVRFGLLAEKRAIDSKRNEGAAVRQSQLAHEAIRDMIYEVNDELANIPEAQSQRRQVLLTALARLDELILNSPVSTELREDKAAILMSLAQITLNIGGPDGMGGDALALDYMKQANEAWLEIETVDETQQQRIDYNRSIALGDILALTIDDLDIESLEKLTSDLVTLRRRTFESNPNNWSVIWALVDALAYRSDWAVEVGNLELAEQLTREGVQLADAQQAEQVDTRPSLGTLGFALERLGDLLTRKEEFAEAELVYVRAADIGKRCHADDPNNVEVLAELAGSYERLGEVALRQNDMDKAESYFLESLIWADKSAARSPEASRMRAETGVNFDKLAKLFGRKGERVKQIDAVQKAIQVRQPWLLVNQTNEGLLNRVAINYRQLISLLVDDEQDQAAIQSCLDAVNFFEMLEPTELTERLVEEFTQSGRRLSN